MAESTTITLPDIESFKQKALFWANHFKVVCLLDSNYYAEQKYKSKEWILAADSTDELICGENAFEELKKFHAKSNSTIFGFFSYDLKNQIEKLESRNFDGLKFPELYFFKPRYLFEIMGDKLTVNRNYPETFDLIERISNHKPQTTNHKPQFTKLQMRTGKIKYSENVERIKTQIEDGDFYELNYCNEFYATDAQINPIEIFLKLNEKANAPFSCFFKWHEEFLLCASPERFLKKEGDKLISQPIKGTIQKGDTKEENERLKSELQTNPKERGENVMIVDLVRNDLARTSKAGTIKVEELCGIYEFNTVNQMISTVTSEIDKDFIPKRGNTFIDAIKNAFPMGSMTGAPKVEVMQNIERYEDFKRGLYSGSVGYITHERDFDLNVVIRSILYNSTEKYLSVRVGGAITYDSIAEKEWDEILLKASLLLEVLHAEI